MVVKLRPFPRFRRKSSGISVSAPVQQGGKTSSRQSIFLVIDKYLWLHGIGFKHGISFTRKNLVGTLVSLLIAAIAEGNFLFGVYANCIRINSGSNIKGVSVDIAIKTFQFVMRILFYTTRKKMDSVLLKFENSFDGVVRDQTPAERFKLKLILLLSVSDLIPLFCKLNYVYTATSAGDDLLYAGYIPQAYASAVIWWNPVVEEIVVVERAFIAIFCSVCFMLKESLSALNEYLKNSDANLENLSRLFLKISSVISSINCLFHAHLLIVFLLLLTSAFRNAYYAAFYSYGSVSYRTQDTVSSFCLFFQFAYLCLFGSYVINAASNIKATCQILAHKHDERRNLHFISLMKEGIDGFKILNSIVIDSSLILSAIGVLLTYGILIATFNTADSSA